MASPMMRTPRDIENELIVLRAQDGSRDAMAALYARWSPVIRRHAVRLTQREDAAEDVAQEAWLAIARGLRRLRDPARFPGWALRITGNKAANWIRRAGRRRDVERAAPPRESGEAHPDGELDGLAEAIRALPDHQRHVVELFYRDGIGVLGVAEALSIPVGTVKSRLNAARASLRAAMERPESAVI